ncbi:unnamed protein product [Blepharisma stoltei]|uniref:Uncharacterized protein n=1 Tax=Blepharisma stoltei TaxID=1481888 RepID=A0AAU9JUU5_9CILI|nr:unnamed protein product [Blepharisma stoltei]
MQEDKKDGLFKIVIIGDSGVGKSCLLARYTYEQFDEAHIVTIGVDFQIRTLNVDGKNIMLQIWDTAGQERFRTIITGYYRNADGVIFVFDKTNRESFNHIDDWVKEVDKFSGTCMARILVGSKSDMPGGVSKEEAEEKANKFGFKYVESSAKKNYQVDLIFESIAKSLIQIQDKPKRESTRLSKAPAKKKKKCC